jgi:hypothetical protein
MKRHQSESFQSKEVSDFIQGRKLREVDIAN